MCAIPNTSATRLLCGLTMSVVLMTGCSSMHRVALNAGGRPQVSPQVGSGDQVRLTLRDGRRVRFTVDSVDPAAIIARDDSRTRYEYSDILTVERRGFSKAKTGVLVGGIVGGLVCFLWTLSQAAFFPG